MYGVLLNAWLWWEDILYGSEGTIDDIIDENLEMTAHIERKMVEDREGSESNEKEL